MKTVMIFGTFDIVHKGHEYLIEYAKQFGQVIIVVARDANVSKDKQRIHRENFRRKTLTKKYPECRVILGNKQDYLKVVRDNSPDIIVLGYDQKVTKEQLNYFRQKLILVKKAKSFKENKYKSRILKKKKRILIREYFKKIFFNF
jgi:cytidyltransferase-like protein